MVPNPCVLRRSLKGLSSQIKSSCRFHRDLNSDCWIQSPDRYTMEPLLEGQGYTQERDCASLWLLVQVDMSHPLASRPCVTSRQRVLARDVKTGSSWEYWWFSGRILACHAGGPGSIPGQCIALAWPVFVLVFGLFGLVGACNLVR